MNYLDSGAIISADKQYRYLLYREWGTPAKVCVFIMLNPSTADGNADDPTIRKCVQFAKLWRCEKLVVVNLFAFRATMPIFVLRANDPYGPNNYGYVKQALNEADLVVCGWGNYGHWLGQDRLMMNFLNVNGVRPQALGVTKSGQPRHPLYMPYKSSLCDFELPL